MDNKQVEAVARAMAVAEDDDPDRWWQDYTRSARAAITVIEAATPLASLQAENEALREALVGIERIAEKNTGISGARSLQAAMHAISHTARAVLTKQGGGM